MVVDKQRATEKERVVAERKRLHDLEHKTGVRVDKNFSEADMKSAMDKMMKAAEVGWAFRLI